MVPDLKCEELQLFLLLNYCKLVGQNKISEDITLGSGKLRA